MGATAANPLTAAAGRNESLHRAFRLLKLLAEKQEGATVASLASDSGLPRSTVSRLLASLFDVGAVARPGTDRLWILGPAISQLSRSVQNDVALQIVGSEIVGQAAAELKETCMMGVPVAETVATVTEEFLGTHLLGISGSWKGKTVSNFDSGFVRLLLAELPEERSTRMIKKQHSGSGNDIAEMINSVNNIREVGYSIAKDTLEKGLSGVGVPVRKSGKLIAMLATYLPTSRFTSEFQHRAVEVLLRSAESISQRYPETPLEVTE